MTEHVHEWTYTRHEADPNIVYWSIRKDEQYIGIDVTKEAVALGLCRRLNATERLSAKVARRNGAILRIDAERLSYGKQTQGFSDSQDMIAYADILEGKDG